MRQLIASIRDARYTDMWSAKCEKVARLNLSFAFQTASMGNSTCIVVCRCTMVVEMEKEEGKEKKSKKLGVVSTTFHGMRASN